MSRQYELVDGGKHIVGIFSCRNNIKNMTENRGFAKEAHINRMICN